MSVLSPLWGAKRKSDLAAGRAAFDQNGHRQRHLLQVTGTSKVDLRCATVGNSLVQLNLWERNHATSGCCPFHSCLLILLFEFFSQFAVVERNRWKLELP